MSAALPYSLAACASAGPSVAPTLSSSPASMPAVRVIPTSGYRIVSPSTGTDVTQAQLLDRVSHADVVFFGEQHDDPETHRAEFETLSAIGKLGRPVVLSLEMFERDVQPVLNDYLTGRITESDFLARSRPWPRYATDYRRLVELARANRWPVVAADVPRPLAAAVGRKGLAALDTLAPAERLNAARENSCPIDDYHARFMDSMHSHSTGSGGKPEPGDSLPTAMAERFYLAQCVKDETMAESIVNAKLAAPSNAIVVISAVPVPDPMVAPIAPEGGVAGFVIFTKGASH